MINVALYGGNGHQIQRELEGSAHGRLIGYAGIPGEELSPAQRTDPQVTAYGSFEELLADPRVDLVSLCSPVRREQADQAVRALEAGKHVYAEKPCAMDERDLDAILRTAVRTGRRFHEMAGTAWQQPYLAMGKVVRSGVIGDVVQIIAEKSYPNHDRRPQDEDVDGGLICQNAIHAVRFITHVAGMRIRSVQAIQTGKGNRVPGGGLCVASCLMFTLANEAVASVTANYLNPSGTGIWGDESLRILGTHGFVESTQGGQRTRLVVGSDDHGPLDLQEESVDYLDLYLRSLVGQARMPVSLEEEVAPTRWVIRGRACAQAA